jgi:hypothetical protein
VASRRKAVQPDPPAPSPAPRRLTWVFLALYAALGFTHGYITVARFDPVEQMDYNDSVVYLRLYDGQPLDQVLRVYRWRALTPLVVRAMPLLPEALTTHYQMDPRKAVRFKWAAWNGLGTILASLALLLLMRSLGFSALQAGVGGLLYATSFQAAAEGFAILVDPWANAAIAASIWLALERRWLWLTLVFGLGLFIKETLELAPLYALLLRPAKPARLLAALAPGLAAYAWFRYVAYPGGSGVAFTADYIAAALASVLTLGHLLYAAAEFTLNFVLLAPLAWLGWRDTAGRPDLRRMTWVLPALALAPFFLGTELTRPWFGSFPILIPLAVLGLWRLLGYAGPPQALQPQAR